jgi:hypothetical protein
MTIGVCGMLGMGDAIYQRPILRAMQRMYGELTLITAYPQFFADLGIRQCPWNSSIRTTQKNVRRSRFDSNDGTSQIGLRYDPPDLHKGVTVFASMERLTGVRMKTICMDLPDFGPPPIAPPYILVRPASIRTDWVSASRNPRPEYIAQAAAMARQDGHKIVLVGDIDPGYEDALLPLPEADVSILDGRLSTEELMALTAHATGVISPVGWAVPASLAYQIPAMIIVGGQNANNHPNVLTDKRLAWNGITWAMPDRPCMCGDILHRCDLEISDLASFYKAFAKSIRSASADRREAA